MANTKLMKVMEYLINEQEDKARDLLHQIFIEKARAIHEEMMMQEEPEMGGDATEDLADDIAEIEAEEHYDEDTDMEDADDVSDAVEDLSDEMEVDADEEEVDMEMDADEDEDMADMDAADADMEADEDSDEEVEDIDHKLMDLEAAIEELRKEFEALEDVDSADADAEEEKVDEAWEAEIDEADYDDLAEGIAHELDTVTAAKSGEVGSGKFARAEVSTHSPVPPTQKDQMGAKPVKTGLGKKAQGYDREMAPVSKDMGAGTGRRKDAEDHKHPVSKEGSTKALLNKDRSEGFGAPNTRSPIQGR